MTKTKAEMIAVIIGSLERGEEIRIIAGNGLTFARYQLPENQRHSPYGTLQGTATAAIGGGGSQSQVEGYSPEIGDYVPHASVDYSCIHTYNNFTGLTETYSYCTRCDKKKET